MRRGLIWAGLGLALILGESAQADEKKPDAQKEEFVQRGRRPSFGRGGRPPFGRSGRPGADKKKEDDKKRAGPSWRGRSPFGGFGRGRSPFGGFGRGPWGRRPSTDKKKEDDKKKPSARSPFGRFGKMSPEKMKELKERFEKMRAEWSKRYGKKDDDKKPSARRPSSSRGRSPWSRFGRGPWGRRPSADKKKDDDKKPSARRPSSRGSSDRMKQIREYFEKRRAEWMKRYGKKDDDKKPSSRRPSTRRPTAPKTNPLAEIQKQLKAINDRLDRLERSRGGRGRGR